MATSDKIIMPIASRKGLEGIPEGLPPEEVERLQKLQARLTNFVLYLIQAFLRTGYYTPDHPESKKAKEGLYQLFKKLFETEDELAFLVREEHEKQEVLVEGVLPEAQKLSRMMLKGMGELYVPKFAKYMERKDLVSLTLKSRMGQEEFSRFVDIMSEPSLVDTRRKQDKERFAQLLLSRGILNISYIFNEDLLAPDREIPWRARVTLSRMRKDLKMIPLLEKTLKRDYQDMRKSLLWDALRPIRQSDLFCAILQNSDLSATSEHREELIEDEIISYLRRQYLTGTAKIFLREHLALKQLKKDDAFEAKSNRLAKKVAYRLRETATPETESILEDYFRNQLIGLDDVTPRLRDKIILEKMTDKFLNYTDQFFRQLDQAKEKETFLSVARSFVRIIPELIRRDRYTEVLRIIETFRHHFEQRKMWALLAGQVLEEIGQGSIPVLLEERFLTGKKEVRIAIFPVFVSLEIGAIPHLLTILKKSEDQWVRKNACEALIQIGPVAAMHLLKELERQQTSAETTCDILRVLGEIQSKQWKGPLSKILRQYVSHEQAKLREQALHSLCQIDGPGGEEVFLKSLNDTEWEVRKRAVWCLGMIKSLRGIERLMEMLDHISTGPSPQGEQLETQIYHALGISGNMTITGRTIEQILLQILEKRGIKQWWNPFQKNLLSEPSLGAVCDALGKIGTVESLGILSQLAKDREGSWAPKARESSKRIEERTSLSKS
jgi:HEAT repeats